MMLCIVALSYLFKKKIKPIKMRIEHIAIWTADLDRMREFYLKYFDASSGELYVNSEKKFSSYFIRFNGGNARLELMNRNDILRIDTKPGSFMGLTHFAITVGNIAKVNEIVELLRNSGYTIASEPRTTGDGYYEAGILDPERNLIELVAENN